MAIINIVQLADALDIDGVTPVQNVFQGEDDVTGQVFTMNFPLGTSLADATSQVNDADTAEKPPPDPIEAMEPKWQFNSETNEYCVFGEDGLRLFILKREGGNTVFALLTDVNDGRIGVGIADPAADHHVRRYDNTTIRSEATLVDSDALFQAVNDAQPWSWGVTGVGDKWILANAFDLATKIRLAMTLDGRMALGADDPDENAVLDLVSTVSAFMPPRMTTVERDAIPSPKAGMVVYNTTANVLNFHNGTSWGAV